MNTATKPRAHEPVCPPWCESHLEGYQAWEEDVRSHDGRVTTVADIEVSVQQTEDRQRMHTPCVEVYVNRDGLLTRTQARELAQALLQAADTVEAAL